MCVSIIQPLLQSFIIKYKGEGINESQGVGEYCVIHTGNILDNIIEEKKKLSSQISQVQPLHFTNKETVDQRCNVI